MQRLTSCIEIDVNSMRLSSDSRQTSPTSGTLVIPVTSLVKVGACAIGRTGGRWVGYSALLFDGLRRRDFSFW